MTPCHPWHSTCTFDARHYEHNQYMLKQTTMMLLLVTLTLQAQCHLLMRCLWKESLPEPLPRAWAQIQRSTGVPLGRGALSLCPCGDPWGDTPPIRNKDIHMPLQSPQWGQTLRSLLCLPDRSRSCRPPPTFALARGPE